MDLNTFHFKWKVYSIHPKNVYSTKPFLFDKAILKNKNYILKNYFTKEKAILFEQSPDY